MNMLSHEIDNQLLIHGDCLDIIKTFEDKSIDIIVTSPPYNIGINYNSYYDSLDQKKYLTFIHDLFVEIKRVLKDSGSIFLNVGSTNINPWVSYDVANCLRPTFILQNNIVWVKSICISDDQIFGHYKPINSDRYTNHMFEHIFHFTKNGNVKLKRKSIGVPYKYKVNLKAVTVTEDIRCRGNTWFIPYETIHSKKQRGNHPAVFPKKLVENCIKLHGYDNNTIVCDPFVGSGTTLVVTRELKCKGIGIEVDEVYFNYAKKVLFDSI